MSIIENVKYVTIQIAALVVTGVTFAEGLDIAVKVVSCAVAVVVALIHYGAYRSRKRVEDEQLKQLKEKKNESK
jgi:uncharacterized membrane protein